jgi:hypothetical protein
LWLQRNANLAQVRSAATLLALCLLLCKSDSRLL